MVRIPVARNPPRPLRRDPRWLRRLPAPARGRLRRGWGWLAASLGYGPTLLILLVALPALLAVYQFPQPRHVTVGAGDDGLYLRDFFAREEEPGEEFRWSGAAGRIVVPGAPGNTTWQATLRLSGARGGAASPPLDVLADRRLPWHF